MQEYYVYCFPRSGSLYLRHICRQFLKIKKQIMSKDDPNEVFFHTHFQPDITTDTNRKLICIIRDYHECCLSHAKRRGKRKRFKNETDYDSALKLLTFSTNVNLNKDVSISSVVKTYDNFKGNKILIYYENLINNVDIELDRLSRFLKVPEHLSFIKNNIKNISENASQQYNKVATIYSQLNLTFHQDLLSKLQLQKMDNILLKDLGPKLFNQYLLQYLHIV